MFLFDRFFIANVFCADYFGTAGLPEGEVRVFSVRFSSILQIRGLV